MDCEYYEWSEWSTCSVSCGGGVKLRSRLIKIHELNGGKPCNKSSLDGNHRYQQIPSDTNTEKTVCNTDVCPPGTTHFAQTSSLYYIISVAS